MTTSSAHARHADHPIAAQFLGRWSPRAFDGSAMTQADMLTLLEAARWAPSASNLQPWRFVWALHGEAGFDAIAAALVPSNHGWAHKAAGLVVVASRTINPSPDVTKPNRFHAFDTGAAWAHLALQAHLNGFFAHGMAGYDGATLASAIALPADHATHAVVAIGRHGDPATLPEALQARETPSGRLPLSETTRHGSF
ncbi:MAG: nitroreductase family protein [Alphaproteobacteria bacterium]